MVAMPESKASLNDKIVSLPHGLKKQKLPARYFSGILLMIILFSGLLAYSNSLHSPFIFDDIRIITNNPYIRLNEISWQGIENVFKTRKARGRPLANLSIALNYYFNGFNVTGYHAVNLIIHLATGLLLFFFIKNTLKIASRSGEMPEDIKNNVLPITFFTTLLWIVHPANTQSVTYTVQRMNSMAAMFYLLSLLFYIKGRMARQAPCNGEGFKARRITAGPWFAGCAVSGILSLASKQNVAMLPIFILLYEWFFFQDLRRLWSRRTLVWCGCALGLLAVIAMIFMGTDPRSFTLYASQNFTLTQRLLTETRVVLYYISIFFFPDPQRLNLDHTYPLSYFVTEPLTTLLCILAIFFILVFSVYGIKKNRVVVFCLLWFFGNLAIESSFIGLALIFEHRVYLPGMLLGLPVVLSVFKYVKRKRELFVCFCVIAVVFGIWTYQRNNTWGDKARFWKDCMEKAPHNARPAYNLAKHLQENGDIDGAIRYYTKTVKMSPITPYHERAYNNLGNIFLSRNRPKQAIRYFVTALSIDSNFLDAYTNLANAYIALKEYDKAVAILSKILKRNPGHIQARISMGAAMFRLNRLNEAENQYLAALRMDPQNTEAHNNLGVLLISKHRFQEAEQQFLYALKLNPDYAKARNNLKRLQALMKQLPQNQPQVSFEK